MNVLTEEYLISLLAEHYLNSNRKLLKTKVIKNTQPQQLEIFWRTGTYASRYWTWQNINIDEVVNRSRAVCFGTDGCYNPELSMVHCCNPLHINITIVCMHACMHSHKKTHTHTQNIGHVVTSQLRIYELKSLLSYATSSSNIFSLLSLFLSRQTNSITVSINLSSPYNLRPKWHTLMKCGVSFHPCTF
jgi:hypothetical protein